MILILAGTYREYLEFLRVHGVGESFALYVHHHKQVHGYGPNTVMICCGTWWLRPSVFLKQVELRAKSQGMWILAETVYPRAVA